MAKNRDNNTNEPEAPEVEDFIADLLTQAITDRASDIHVEPNGGNIRIRFRVDGILRDKMSLPIQELDRLVIVIKAMANLDIASRIMPQDGHFEFAIQLPDEAYQKKAPSTEAEPSGVLARLYTKTGKEKHIESDFEKGIPLLDEGKRKLDIRVSVFPTVNGEAIVLRLLNRQEFIMSLENLGMKDEALAIVKKLTRSPYGMVLITGPSGSGKTTTLYSILNELKSSEKNIMTLEDPVELNIEGIRQVEVRPDQGFDFARGIRSVLRQDPDVMMIGEIRDQITADNAVRASLAGKTIFSTVHANTVIGTIARLLDMHIDRSLVAYAINGIISQRLVRKICPDCKISYMPSQEYLKYFGLEDTPSRYVRGKGCSECQDSGFKGRIGIFEVFEFDHTLRALIVENASIPTLEEYAAKAGMVSLKSDARDKILAGITTVEEAAKVI